MVETEITNILEDYIDNDEDYFKVVDFIENQDKMLYAKNHTNKILINEKKELQQRIDKAIEYIKEWQEHYNNGDLNFSVIYGFDVDFVISILEGKEVEDENK